MGGSIENARDQLEKQIFDYLDQTLPASTKKKLTATEVKLLISAFADFTCVRQGKTKSDVSKFDQGVSGEFMSDLSKV